MVPKVYVVTGAGNGIGKEVVKSLLEDGLSVIAIDIDSFGLEQINIFQRKLKNSSSLLTYCCDLSIQIERENLWEKLAQSNLVIDVLINNAGGINPKFKSTSDGYEQTFSINYLGCAHLCLLFLSSKATLGFRQIINITSNNYKQGKLNLDSVKQKEGVGLFMRFSRWIESSFKQKVLFLFMGYYSMTSYSQSKLAQVIFTKLLSKKSMEKRVCVNCIHPGIVRSNIVKSSFKGFSRYFWDFLSYLIGINPEESAEYIRKTIHRIGEEELNGIYFNYENGEEDLNTMAFEKEQELWEWTLQNLELK